MRYADRVKRKAEIREFLGPELQVILDQEAKKRLLHAAAEGIYQKVLRLRMTTLKEVIYGL